MTLPSRRHAIKAFIYTTGILATSGTFTRVAGNPRLSKDMALDPALARLKSRFSDIEEEMERSLYRLKATERFRLAKIENEMEEKVKDEKMVCIDDSFTDERAALCNALPVRGRVYTLRGIRVALLKDNEPHVALLFDEIVSPRLVFGKELGFCYDRFEPYDSDDE